MPVISSAIAAVAAAVTAASVATVTAAVVSVSMLVGTIGLGMTAIGLATGDKGMLKAGKIMGYVGLAGVAAGGLSSLVTEGLTTGVGEAAGAAGNVFAAPDVAAGIDTAIGQAGQAGAGTVLAPAAAQAAPAVGAGSVLAPGAEGFLGTAAMPTMAGGAGQSTITGSSGVDTLNDDFGAASTPAASQAGSVAPAEQSYQNLIAEANQAPTGAASFKDLLTNGSLGNGPQAGNIKGWWGGLSDTTKGMIAISGGQMLAGAAGGWFQGLSAADRLELDQLINEQKQAQIQYQNKNASYAPSLKFNGPTGPAGKGLLSTAPKA